MYNLSHFENVSILGVSYADAPERITSESIEEQLKEPMQRLKMRRGFLSNYVGIKARRFWPRGTQPSEVGALAGQKLLDDTGIDRKKIGVLVNTSVCKDYIEPSVASIIHSKLGLSAQCWNFDVSNACMGFVNGIQLVANLIESGQVEYGLIVDGEDSRELIENTIKKLQDPEIDVDTFRQNFATLTLGSGAAAMLMCRSDQHPEAAKLLTGIHRAATEHNHLCHGQRTEMYCDPIRMLRAGLDLMRSLVVEAKQVIQWNPAKCAEIVLHQVNAPHTNSFLDFLGYAHEKIFRIYPEFGNVGPATIPISLAKSLEAGRIKKGDRISIMGVGSGINGAILDVAW